MEFRLKVLEFGGLGFGVGSLEFEFWRLDFGVGEAAVKVWGLEV